MMSIVLLFGRVQRGGLTASRCASWIGGIARRERLFWIAAPDNGHVAVFFGYRGYGRPSAVYESIWAWCSLLP